MSETPGYQRFLAELKRRRVFRVAAVYGAVAFVVLQVADILVPALHLPDGFTTGVAVVAILAFPIALVLAWAFENSPEGVRRTDPAATAEIEAIVAQPAARRWPSGVLALAGTVALAVGGWLALSSRGSDAPAAAGEAAGDARPALAVLPFDNLSRDSATLPFTDGLHDDLLTQLSKIGSLKVISRTSVQEYRDSPKGIPEIGVELGVAYVLEGGVQRAGDQFRINVQLIDAGSEGHLWAEQYTGELSVAGIFAVQTEIATKIADALRATLTADQRETLARVPTEDLEAYEAYRRALRAADDDQTEPALRAGERLVDFAIARDSSFAEAWAVKSALASSYYHFHFDRSDSITNAALAWAERALDLEPDLAQGHWALSGYHYRVNLDFDRALAEVERAIAGMPGQFELYMLAGYILRRKGDMAGALERFRVAMELDPRRGTAHYATGETLGLLRRYEEAERELRRAIELDPDHPYSHGFLAATAVRARGDTAGARAVMREADRLGAYETGKEAYNLVELSRLERDGDGMLRELEGHVVYRDDQNMFAPAALFAGQAWELKGDGARARAAYDSARAMIEERMRSDPDDPRYYSSLGIALAGLGREAEAAELAEEGLRRMPPEREAWRGGQRLRDAALVWTMTGRYEEAIDALAKLLAIPSELSAWDLRLDPLWDPLRGDPRFQALTETG